MEEVTKNLDEEYPKVIGIFQHGIWNLTCMKGIKIKRLKLDVYSGETIESGDLNLNDVMRFKS